MPNATTPNATYWVEDPTRPDFVTNKETGEILQFSINTPNGTSVHVVSDNQDYSVDNHGRVIYVGSPYSYTMTRIGLLPDYILYYLE